MKIAYILVALSFLSSCKSGSNSHNLGYTDSVKQKPVTAIIKANDSIIIINGIRLVMEKPQECNYIKTKSAKDDLEFLNSNIRYFKADTIIANQLKVQEYYQALLLGTHFLEFEETSFKKENFTFSLKQLSIDKYGKCYVGKYYFPTAANSGQTRTTVIINTDKKEISIWNFDDVNIGKDGLSCDFNVRGKHTIYKMNYSLECNSFVAYQ